MANSPQTQSGCNGASSVCYCPLTGVMDVISKKYAIQLISVIGTHESVRFSDLESHLSSASSSTLSDRLTELAEEGLVTRTQYNEIPPRVEYELSDEGRELREKLMPLLEWANQRT